MSLLRRIDQASPDSRRARPVSPRIRRAASLPQRWQHETGGRVLSVAMSADHRLVFATSRDGEVLAFDDAGRRLWRAEVEGSAFRLALAEDAGYVLVGAVEEGRKAYLFDYSGQLVRTFETGSETWGVGLTPDAGRIVLGTANGMLHGFDGAGASLFQRDLDSPVRQVALTPDGERIFLGCDDGHVYALDGVGEVRWQHATGGRIWAGVVLAAEAGWLVAGSNDGHVYALDYDGELCWRYDTGHAVNRVAITPDGRLCAAVGQGKTVLIFNEQGHVQREFTADEVLHGVAIAADGSTVVAGSNEGTLYVFDRARDFRTRHQTLDGRAYDVAVSRTGRTIAAASAGCSVYLFENAKAPRDAGELARASSRALVRLIIQRARNEFAVSPHAGLASWFAEFERSLRAGQFDVCRALLAEVNEGDTFGLSERERAYTRSLEGAYWLFRGVAFHRRHQYDAARACYERSRAIQAELNNKDGVGQVLAVLSSLPGEEVVRVDSAPDASAAGPPPAPDAAGADDDHTPASSEVDVDRLLDEIIAKPRVLGTSEKLLEERLAGATAAEQLQIVLLAKRSGYIRPLIQALRAEERVIRAAASAALTLLEPGPDYGVVKNMLASAHTFVRWQALRILRHRAENRADEFAEAKAMLWPAVRSRDVEAVPDPLARREEALLVAEAGDESDTDWLVSRLDDPDPDTRLAVIDALGEIGSRDAIPALQNIEDHEGFMGESVQHAAQGAIQSIERRSPVPVVERVVFCDRDPRQQEVVTAYALFLAETETVYCIVEVAHAELGGQVAVRWLRQGEVLAEADGVVTETDETPVALVEEIERADDRRRGGRSRRPRRPPFGDRADGGPRPRSDRARRRPPPLGREAPRRSRAGARRPPLGERRPLARSPRRRSRRRRPGDTDPVENILPGADRPRSPFPRRDASARRPRRSPEDAPRPPGTDAPAEAETAAPEPVPAGPGSLLRRWLFRERDAESPDRSLPRRRPVRPRPESDDLPDWLAASPPGRAPRRARRRPASPSRSRERERRPSRRPVRDRPGSARPGPPGRFSGGERRPVRDRPGRERGGREGLLRARPTPPARPDHVRPLVFALPRPAEGWQPGTYRLEVALAGEDASAVEFTILERVVVERIEPGYPGENEFEPCPVFMAGAAQIACTVSLGECPPGVPVNGWIHSVASGAPLAHATVFTAEHGPQTVELVWRDPGLRPGVYRVAVAVGDGDAVSTEIEVLDQVQPRRVTVCHQVDGDGGAVGTDWPFYPGDTPHCVVELGQVPPGVEIVASWYGQHDRLPASQPYRTTAAPAQRAAFTLSLRGERASLKPGHYSVVVSGPVIAREERSFEVHPYPFPERVRRATRSAGEWVLGWLRVYHLDRVLGTLALTLLLAAALLLTDALLDYGLGERFVPRDPVLALGHAISQAGQGWAVGWLALGAGYGALYAAARAQIGGERLARAYRAVTLLLAAASGALISYQVAHIVFGPGHRWPDALAGLFAGMRWLHPLVPWLALVAGLGSAVYVVRQDDGRLFHRGAVVAGLGAVGLALAGYAGALASGLSLGVIGGLVGALLDLVGVDNDLGGGLRALGAGVGLLAGPVIALGVWGRGALLDGWEDWIEERQRRRAERFTPLDYLRLRGLLPLSADESLRLARAARDVLAWGAAVTVALLALFDPLTAPALHWLYDTPEGGPLAGRLVDLPLIAALGLALLATWPWLLFRLFQAVRSPDLETGETRLVRRMAGIAVLPVIVGPVAVALLSRTPLSAGLVSAAAIYWANRLALLACVLVVIAGWVGAYHRRPETVTLGIRLRLTFDKALLGLLALAGILLLPVWVSALVMAVALGALGGGIFLLGRAS